MVGQGVRIDVRNGVREGIRKGGRKGSRLYYILLNWLQTPQNNIYNDINIIYIQNIHN